MQKYEYICDRQKSKVVSKIPAPNCIYSLPLCVVGPKVMVISLPWLNYFVTQGSVHQNPLQRGSPAGLK